MEVIVHCGNMPPGALAFTSKILTILYVSFDSLLCCAVEGEERTDGEYKCTACDEKHSDLDEMLQHLLRHSNFKFYFCVHCLGGCSTLSEMARHTMAHMGKVCSSRIVNETHLIRPVSIKDEVALPASNPELLEKPRSPENLEPPRSYVPKEPQECPTKEESSEEYRCIICGFTFDRLDVVLFHTEQEHPTERDVINRLRLRLLRAAFDPNGYRLKIADERESASSSTAS